MRRRAGGPAACAAALALGLLLSPRPAGAQEWHEAYRSGLAALARGDHARAAEALRRAVALRPEPGRNVLTYGTNVEPRYFPYLRLAEALLGLGQLDAARDVLQRSASFGEREPAEERQKLLARLEAAVAQKHPSPSPPPPTVAAPVATPLPTPIATASPEPIAPVTPTPTASARATSAPSARPRAEAPAAAEPRPRAEASAPTAASAPVATGETATGTLEIVSQPPGASAYVDDELVGATDPQTGRLVKTGLAAGRHRVRVSRAGHEDAVRDIDVPEGRSTVFQVALGAQREGALGTAGFVAAALGVVALVAMFAWIALRPPKAAVPIWKHTSRPGRPPEGGVATPSRQGNPGARRDEHGQEWFGDYHLIELLGRGGMASVYKAERHAELSALKRPLANLLDDEEFLNRFSREAEIGRSLNHPNIVRILERGHVEEVPYFSMELLGGGTLQQFVSGHRAVAPRQATSIVVQVAEALDFAHSKGVVHRDLKPSNIMLLEDGTAKVMDFGIARARQLDGLTATGAFLGTPDYVAPEMVEGRGTEPRSDLYGLGVVFFELLAGRRPFEGGTPFTILKQHCTAEPPPPSRFRHEVPPELDAIVLRLLRKSPEERPASAEELVVALRDWLHRAA